MKRVLAVVVALLLASLLSAQNPPHKDQTKPLPSIAEAVLFGLYAADSRG